MGVKNLWDILESCKKTLPLHYLQNKRVCIDLSCWIVQLHNVNKTHCAIKYKLYLRGLFHRLRALIALNCSLIFVADGSIPAIKLPTYRRRLNQENEIQASQDETISIKLLSLRRNMSSEFSCMIKEAKLLGAALGIPCLDGIEEAEAQCALLNSESLCDGCFTSDSDAFLFGARTVYRDICLGEGGHVVCYEMDDIERKLGFGRNSLITLALLLGSDYSPGVHGIGRESACQIVKSIGDSAVLQQVASKGLSFAKKPKGSKKQGQIASDNENDPKRGEHNLQKPEYMRVINAYLKPKCHSADSDVVLRVLALYPFNRQQLQQICAQYFDWPSEKTDEYILPKVAERDLRRYANLRHISSELGVPLSMDEMPIKCPISGIVKQKKLQGRDCFEVSWEELDGLETSTVPADLVESACPEKILEFQERRAQSKKPKCRRSRQKKVESNGSLDEIKLKFDNLLLDVEQEGSAISNTTLVRGSTSENIGDVALVNRINPRKDFDTVPECSKGRSATVGCSFTSYGCNSTVPRVDKPEVIDLLSPTPKPLARRVAKVKESDVQCVNVIELSESENEMSPEHEQKARELRLFIASIKDDIVR